MSVGPSLPRVSGVKTKVHGDGILGPLLVSMESHGPAQTPGKVARKSRRPLYNVYRYVWSAEPINQCKMDWGVLDILRR